MHTALSPPEAMQTNDISKPPSYFTDGNIQNVCREKSNRMVMFPITEISHESSPFEQNSFPILFYLGLVPKIAFSITLAI